MKILDLLLSESVINALGWTLLHSLWQGALVALILAVSLILLRKASSKLRYLFSSLALIMIFAFTVVTFLKMYNPTAETNVSISTFKEYHEMQAVRTLLQAYGVTDPIDTNKITSASKNMVLFLDEHIFFIVVIWFAGLLFFMLRFAGGLIYSRRLKCRQIRTPGKEMQEMLIKLKKRLNFSFPVKILESFHSRIPMVIGSIKPVILIPVGILSQIPAEQLEVILIHELTHISRRDYLFNLMQSIIEVIFFYHPAVWWMSHVIRNERELACDDKILSCGQDPLVYAKALANLREMEVAPLLIPAFTGRKYNLLTRIQRLMNRNHYKPEISKPTIYTLLVIMVFAAIISISATFSERSCPEGKMHEIQAIEQKLINEVPVQTEIINSQKISSELIIPDEKPETNHEPAIKPMQKIIVNDLGMALPDTILLERNDSIRKVIQREIDRARESYARSMEENKEALRETERIREQIKEAHRDYVRALQEQHELIREEYQKAMQEYMQKMRDLYKSDTGNLMYAPFQPFFIPDSSGLLSPDFYVMPPMPYPDLWIDMDKDLKSIYFYRGESDADTDYDFDYDYDYDYDKDHDIRYQYFNDSILFDTALHWSQPFRFNLDSAWQFKHQLIWGLGRDNLEDMYHNDYGKNWQINKDERLLQGYLTSPHDFWDFNHFTLERIIKKELIRDGLIEEGEEYVVEITLKKMYINGEQQSDKVREKYKRILESVLKEDFKEGKTFILRS